MRNFFMAAAFAGSLALAASAANATTFVLDSYTVTTNVGNASGNNGLTVDIQNRLNIPGGGLDIDLGASNPQTYQLFNIYTPETAVNWDDLSPVPISVSFDFSAPTPNSGPTTVNGTTQGNLVLFGLFHNGSVQWSNQGVFTWTAPGFTNPGVMDISLSNGTFDAGLAGLHGGARGGYVVNATFDWQNDPFGAAVPEPASWALMIGGFGLAGATLRRRRAAVAAA